ncbi:hypothetical protein P153DRAFT_68485 [Dothidotthia symphoricarpi CBS 119687]|uniref:P-loop containing nucleoside triphosphate hydrolase protein n=1 Tax=Dothidotthia symphoricarpi CBS 119687 TaxID=1392245 RepID=A0A6A6A4H8_9PLEO|nr:uncharacterized protein P153DRAFT_68485 [Dothidotthia symphoricarpi CBS 119687]KAF2126710.1 hypothetical protein P153DRAFT_68485 [Dothidotthia symphoricarpi CBS 119687]
MVRHAAPAPGKASRPKTASNPFSALSQSAENVEKGEYDIDYEDLDKEEQVAVAEDDVVSAPTPAPTPAPAPAPAPATAPGPKSKTVDDIEMSDYESEGEVEDLDMTGTDNAGSSTSSKKVSVYRKYLEDIPEDFKFLEFVKDKTVNPYPSEFDGVNLDVIHKEYRKQDRPDFKPFRYQRQTAQVMFLDSAFSMGSGRRQSVGMIKEDRAQDEKTIKVSFNVDSQMPSVRLHIPRPDNASGETESEVEYQVFANAIKSAHGEGEARMLAGISMSAWNQPMDDASIKEFGRTVARGNSGLVDLAKIQNLMRLRLELVPVGTVGYKRRPIFTGMSAMELQAIRNKGNDEKTKPDLSEFERAIYNLDTACTIDIFRRLDQSDVQLYNKLRNFFVGSMYMCATYKNFWHYQFQLERPVEGKSPAEDNNIFASKCNLENLLPPRWMITEYEACSVNKGGPITKLSAIEWSSFSKFTHYPSIQDCSFVLRLGLARERQAQQTLIKGLAASAEGSSTAHITPLGGVTGGYLAKISLPGHAAGFESELLKPEIDTRLTLKFEAAGQKQITYAAAVVEAQADDVPEEKKFDFDFVVEMTGPVNDFGQQSHKVHLEFIDDKTSGDRARIATESMAKAKLQRDDGVDIPAVIFQTDFSIALDKQNVGQDIPQDTFEKILGRLREVWKLNKEQVASVTESFRSSTGLSLLYGPPGTGKTSTTTVAAYEHCRLGNKVLYACPSNKAVDAALTNFNQHNDRSVSSTQQPPSNSQAPVQPPKERKIRAVRFVGGYKTYQERKKLAGPNATVEDLEGLVNPTILSAIKANPDSLFHDQLEQAIKRWGSIETHSMYAIVKEYTSLLAKAKKGKSSHKDAKADAKKMRVNLDRCTEYFVEHEVDIIFTTCSSACHDTIAGSFKPDVAFVDEAGQATIPDVCMALDPYKESIKWLTMSGDYNQLMPVVIAKKANEGLSLLETSLFRQLVCDPNGRFGYVMLLEQYRQHPDLSDYANSQFYAGKLRNHSSVTQGNPVSKTIKQFFDKLGKAKKNHASVRIAIDVSHDEAQSVKYAETTSFCNAAEARIIAGLVKELLAYVPQHSAEHAARFTRIQAKDIGIVTPYKGQQRFIRNLLLANGRETAEVKVLTEGSVSTTWGVQGGEFSIVFVSLCARDPNNAMEKMKFVALPNALCVQNTRAKYFQVTAGNFMGWCKATAASKKEGVIHQKYFSSFKNLVLHMYNKGDIVSSVDIEAALLPTATTPAQKPTESHFYKALPSLEVTSISAHDKPKGAPGKSKAAPGKPKGAPEKPKDAAGKRKGAPYSKDTRSAKSTKTAATGLYAMKEMGDTLQPLVPTPGPVPGSKREAKKAAQAAKHAADARKRAEVEKEREILDETKGERRNWADDVQAAAEEAESSTMDTSTS